ncbi:putative signal transduction histidine kinase [Thermodesulfobium narugense DSM 14796]|uniref:Oxygen sensor histidine kinase NreB n=1 Tax=Thermodesulfobium narugense DSM 14796 TaxID=747365 RepID=M1E8V7_9BACT|nr:histidine kinase [Thermodesulfobium narugense]AEE15175.1 putative signal transduction histidine kinase [Thermodesulfobium narugense DSM 14796]
MSLKTKILIINIFSIFIITLGIALEIKFVLTQNLEDRLILRTSNMASILSDSIIEPLLSNNVYLTHQILTQYKENNSEVGYIDILSNQNEVLSSTFSNGFPKELYLLQISKTESNVAVFSSEMGKFIDVKYPIADGSLGYIHIGVTEREVGQRIQEIMEKILFLSFFINLLASLLLYKLTNTITANLKKLTLYAKNIALGNKVLEPIIKTNDEVRELFISFKHMLKALERSSKEEIQLITKLKDEEIKRELLKRTMETLEKERKRLSMEIHDSVMQNLASINIMLKIFQSKLDQKEKLDLENIQKLIEATIEELRNIANNLRPPQLEKLGLKSSLESFFNETEKRHNLKTNFDFSISEEKLDWTWSINIYRIIQEAISNIVKHSGANNAFVSIKEINDKIEIEVKDDGEGFDVDETLSKKSNRLGIVDMKERTKTYGGEFFISSTKGGGTIVKISLPKPKNDDIG